jgi:hypothetical protein
MNYRRRIVPRRDEVTGAGHAGPREKDQSFRSGTGSSRLEALVLRLVWLLGERTKSQGLS